MPTNMSQEVESLRAAVDHAFSGGTDKIGVDLESRIIYGMVAAEAGAFKTARGTFDQRSLEEIASLINKSPDGVVSNWGHQGDVGSSDALNAFLGRAKNARVDGGRVRVDLHISPVAFMAPEGGVSLGLRALQRAKLDPRSFGSSLVLAADKISNGRLPAIWRPTAIMSLDLVYQGDAVHGGLLAASKPASRLLTVREMNDLHMRLRHLKRGMMLLNQISGRS